MMIFPDLQALFRFGIEDAHVARMLKYRDCDKNDATVMRAFDSPLMRGSALGARVTPAERVEAHEASLDMWLEEVLGDE